MAEEKEEKKAEEKKQAEPARGWIHALVEDVEKKPPEDDDADAGELALLCEKVATQKRLVFTTAEINLAHRTAVKRGLRK